MKELGHGLPPGRTSAEILARAKYEQRFGEEGVALWKEMSKPLPDCPPLEYPVTAAGQRLQHDYEMAKAGLAARRTWIKSAEDERRQIATELLAHNEITPEKAVETADELLAILYTT